MIRRIVPGFSLLLAALTASAHAQDRSAEARLDDFALPEASEALRVEQLSAKDTFRQPQQPVDRTLARPPRTDTSQAMPPQLSSTGAGGAVVQLPSTRDTRLSQGTAISNRKDSAPGSVLHIGGQDRCDPQLTQRIYAECLRILELRSDEFNAPRPPALSAEQKLLVEQRQRDETLTETSAGLRLRYATATQPDADLQTNQELASIFLSKPDPVSARQPAEETKEPDLGEILQNLGITTTPPPPGSD